MIIQFQIVDDNRGMTLMSVEEHANRIDVWKIPLNDRPQWTGDIHRILSETEILRANKFHNPMHQLDFMNAHFALRSILAQYLGLTPKAIHFEINPYGKPYIASKPKKGRMEFNLSHSGHLALLAVNWGSEIGIDVEQIKPLQNASQIAKRYFTSTEALVLQNTDPGDIDRKFVQLWTAKEALIKGRGMGLSIPLDQFDCSALLSDGVRSCKINPPGTGKIWRIRRIDVQSDYAASLATPESQITIHQMIWSP